MSLHVRNLTPAIIRLDGGDDQMIPTSGGSPNKLSRGVQGLTRGAFNIDYTLAEESCPCAANFYP